MEHSTPQPERPVGLIDTSDEAAMRHWAEKLSVSVPTLRQAVERAGTDPQRVGEYLLRQRTDDHRVGG
ncbi:DUF3606 domain-containing protein [Schlegelella sp. S2-27]|uniref:DUF3606 domain-containing protein n=1 Tax=Caldimonas mangrovi TaxID=2944811 RepID=A0ABT0YU31_9BURK|nr:DUF3606 domain-containing protein [Caldimonas mangrovi]MCM5682268.1 DUF3606 domain-containing protein [Caldimonas mangrovi]